MKDLFLFPIMIAVIAFGFFVITKVDRFISESQRQIDDEKRNFKNQIRIAADNPALLNRILSVLEDCSETKPHIALFLSTGKPNLILEKLINEQLDIVLLSEISEEIPDDNYKFIQITAHNKDLIIPSLGLQIENNDDESDIFLVWKKKFRSKDRDRIIFAIQNEFCNQ